MRKYCHLVPVLLVVTLLFGLAASAWTKEMSIKAIFDQMKKINPGLKDYSAQITININAKWGFVSYTPNMQGNYYFKKPDKHKLELTKAPSYLKKYPHVFGWSLPNPDQFHNRILKSENVGGQDCWAIEMIPKTPTGDLTRQILWVGKKDFLIYRQQYFYKGSSVIQVFMEYGNVNKYRLFKHIKATFEFPAVKISADTEAEYSNYRVNTGLKDSLFKK